MKIEIRKDCKVCGNKIIKKRFRTFCCGPCREQWHEQHGRKDYREKNKEKFMLRARERTQEKLRQRNKELVQCLICEKHFIQVGSHVSQVHKMTAREYREEFELEVKRGTVPAWYRKLKGDIALENNTYKNILDNKKTRFKKGDKKAGRYKRSPIALERLKTLYKFNKHGNK